MTKVYGYGRVSTVQQNLEIQVEKLKEVGVLPENIYTDKKTGTNMEREGFQALMSVVEKGDTVFVCKLDRLGRSVSQIMSLVDDLQKRGIYLVIMDAGIDTRKDEGMGGIMTKALMTIVSLMAEIERELILERTQAGIEKARQNGSTFGRPEVNKDLYELAIIDYLEKEMTSTAIIAKYGKGSNGKDNITEATLFRRVREYQTYQKAIESYLESGKTKTISELIAEGEHKKVKGELKPILKEKKLLKMIKELEG